MKQVTLFEGTVRKIEADTTGWGDTLRTVGVAVTLQVRRSDAEGNFDKETTIHLPKEIVPPVVSDVLIVQVAQLGIEDMAAESELAELPEIPDPGEPYVDEDLDVKLYPQSVDPPEGDQPSEAYDIEEMEADRG